MAVKACMFPPVVGYNTDVLHGAVNTLSALNFASPTTQKKEINPQKKKKNLV